MECARVARLQDILADHWPDVKRLLPKRLPRAVVDAVVSGAEKALRCLTEANGFARFECSECGVSHTMCFTCKSRFCPRCGRARAAEAAARAQERLLNVQHRHLTFSVPSELRPVLYHRRDLLGAVARAAARCTLEAVGTRCRQHSPVPGIMTCTHTYGRDLTFHVHVHVLCTEGGLRADGVWQPVHLFPASQYRRLWQYHLLKELRRALKGNRAASRQIGSLFRKYPTGFIVNVMSRYRHGREAAAYCCRYTGRPPLSERRIVGYDGHNVTISYKDYRDGQEKALTLPAAEFLLRLMQHVWPRYQRDVHYYGLYQPSRRKRNVDAVAAASKYGDQVRPVSALSRRERLEMAMAGRQLNCTICGGHLIFQRLVLPRDLHATQATVYEARAPAQLSLRM